MRPLTICIVSTTSARSRKGNRVTALRWSRLLRQLGHRVRIEEQYRGGPCDLMIALHALRSAESTERFADAYPERPLILALTGTDLYRDIHSNARAQRALARASRLIVLQPLALQELPTKVRSKGRVILQSAEPPRTRPKPRSDMFEVCVLGHLRPVKDPFRAALAARRLPSESRIRVLQIGAALSADMETQAREEQRTNPRYRWIGELPRYRALRLVGRCRLLVLTSILEGGANAISEALSLGVPIVASRIPGSVGLLGTEYPGYFEPRDTRGLARLLRRAETDERFFAKLKAECAKLAWQIQPRQEREALARLLRELPQHSVRAA